MCHLTTKSCADQSTVAEIWPIFEYSRWRSSAILDFKSWKVYLPSRFGGPMCVTMPNFMTIGRTVTELRRQLHRLQVRQRINYKLALLTYKTRSTGNPAYLASLPESHTPARTLQSSNNNLLTAPQLSLALSARAFVSADQLYGTPCPLVVNRLNL